MPKRTADERFWSRVNKTPGCWEWTGALNADGYGVFYLNRPNRQAHRVSFAMASGPIPEGHQVDHICHNRKCVRPDHLRLATPKQNCENLTGAYSNSASGVRGVYWHKRRRKWHASLQHAGRQIHVGYFHDLDEADRAVTAKRLEMFTHNDADRGVNAEDLRMANA
ncbi:HNH endonuclease [Paenarthrobacter nicotinovorans]|uniref:HNH endonuclease n=1 Tax=Paenarthrobacter nicotinovorans TaxID=29320 RepID=UPI0039A53457